MRWNIPTPPPPPTLTPTSDLASESEAVLGGLEYDSP